MRREERQENEKENKEKENKEKENNEKENKENNVVSSCENSEEERQRWEECQTVETSSPAPVEVTNQVHP